MGHATGWQAGGGPVPRSNARRRTWLPVRQVHMVQRAVPVPACNARGAMSRACVPGEPPAGGGGGGGGVRFKEKVLPYTSKRQRPVLPTSTRQRRMLLPPAVRKKPNVRRNANRAMQPNRRRHIREAGVGEARKSAMSFRRMRSAASCRVVLARQPEQVGRNKARRPATLWQVIYIGRKARC